MGDLTPLQPDGVGGEEEESAEAKVKKGYVSLFSYSAVFFIFWYSPQKGHWPSQRDISSTALEIISPQHQELDPSGTHSLEAHIHWCQLDNFK